MQAEKQRAELSQELEDLNERLEEAGGATQAQVELNKRRELELQKIKREMEELALHHESQSSLAKKRFQDSLNELTEQLDNAQKLRVK